MGDATLLASLKKRRDDLQAGLKSGREALTENEQTLRKQKEMLLGMHYSVLELNNLIVAAEREAKVDGAETPAVDKG